MMLAVRHARLYLVCDASQLRRVLVPALRGGVDLVQLRDKHATEREIRDAVAFVRKCSDVPLILNDNAHLAVRARADGVHVGQDDMSPAEARAIVGPQRIVGLSTHSRAQIDAAEHVDYIGVGPVFATPTKPGRAPVGLELVRYAEQHAPVPWFAIGGIDSGNVASLRAARIAVVRAIAAAQDPEAAAAELSGALVGSA
ncbi:MAG: hypothetical protein NVSMB51_04430 [Solirubrobacteraceae bacterium]